MAKNRPSFFERLTGAVHTDVDFDFEEEEREAHMNRSQENEGPRPNTELEHEAQLNVDLINTPEQIIIKALVAGVKPNDLDISITREMVTIRGERIEDGLYVQDDYLHNELFWGSFGRTLMLPEEVEVEEAKAREQHGLLTIVLPKIDKKRETKLEVETGGFGE